MSLGWLRTETKHGVMHHMAGSLTRVVKSHAHYRAGCWLRACLADINLSGWHWKLHANSWVNTETGPKMLLSLAPHTSPGTTTLLAQYPHAFSVRAKWNGISLLASLRNPAVSSSSSSSQLLKMDFFQLHTQHSRDTDDSALYKCTADTLTYICIYIHDTFWGNHATHAQQTVPDPDTSLINMGYHRPYVTLPYRLSSVQQSLLKYTYVQLETLTISTFSFEPAYINTYLSRSSQISCSD